MTGELLALGASHKTAPLELREKLALLDGQVEPFLHELLAEPGVTEAVALSTCNRTELYLVADDPVDAESGVLALLARRAGTRPTELVESIYVAIMAAKLARIERELTELVEEDE